MGDVKMHWNRIYEITWEGEEGILIEVDMLAMVIMAVDKHNCYKGGLTGRKVEDVFCDSRCTHVAQAA